MPMAVKRLLPILVGLVVWALPTPQGLDVGAHRYFAVFAAVVVALITEPVKPALAGLIGVVVAASFKLVPLTPGQAPKPADAIKWALTGFSDGTVWLIFTAFMFALGYEKTGLGKRIALTLIKFMGGRTLGLGCAVALSDLALAPFMPSNTARSGGTIYPIIKNIPPLYGSTPTENQRGVGAYLMWTALAATCVTSSMFLTGLAPNVLAQSLVEKTVKVKLSWNDWFMSFLPVGVILFAAVPFLGYLLYPPTVKKSPEAPAWAAAELKKLGPLSTREILMAVLAMGALALWIFGGAYVNATTAALIALCLMVLLDVVKWDDVLGAKEAWNVLVWFAGLVTLADGLAKTGFLAWFAKLTSQGLAGYSPTMTLAGLVVVFFVSHYLFASVTAHVTALLPVFLAAAMQVQGLNIVMASTVLCATLGIMGILTPYATGPSPIYYGSGYIKSRDFWLLGLVFGVIFLGVFLLVGLPWNIARF